MSKLINSSPKAIHGKTATDSSPTCTDKLPWLSDGSKGSTESGMLGVARTSQTSQTSHEATGDMDG